MPTAEEVQLEVARLASLWAEIFKDVRLITETGVTASMVVGLVGKLFELRDKADKAARALSMPPKPDAN